MRDPIIVALIAVAGVVVSAAVSWLVSAYQIKAGLTKLRLEMQRIYAEKLLAVRIARYEEAYTVIEQVVKAVQRRTIRPTEFRSFSAFLTSWHTKNGFVLTSKTNGRFYTCMRKLGRISERSDTAFLERIENNQQRRELIRDLWRLELALKNDLGVFEVEFFDPDRKFASYQEVDEAHATRDDRRADA